MMRRSTLCPMGQYRGERETSKSSSMKAIKVLDGSKGRKPKDSVQELYRHKRSSLGYKLLDYNTLSTSKV